LPCGSGGRVVEVEEEKPPAPGPAAALLPLVVEGLA
jgi:hypothetical protein